MKIVYYDNWTLGIHHFVNIDKILKEKGHSTLLLHIGSFIGTYKKEEVIEGILCRDIGFYDTKYIHKALEIIKPDVVLTLNSRTFLDRSVDLSCRVLGIKSVFLMHGAMPTGDEIPCAMKTMDKIFTSPVNKIKKCPKYFRFVFPNYIYSSFKSDRRKITSLYFMKIIWAYLKNFTECYFLPPFADELAQDKCLIFAEIYRDYYAKGGFNESRIVVVGNPKNDELFRQIESKEFETDDLPQDVVKLIENNKKYALYLEDAFVENENTGEWTDEYRNNHLTQIAERLKKEDVTLVVKLHPSTKIQNMKVKSDNIIIIPKASISTLSYYASFCIGHISTTVQIPIILNKPVVIPTWDKSKNIWDSYCKHNVANEWNHVEEELNLTVNQKAREEYIKQYITVTKPVSIERIVEEILN